MNRRVSKLLRSWAKGDRTMLKAAKAAWLKEPHHKRAFMRETIELSLAGEKEGAL
jgi:hypothetical protein